MIESERGGGGGGGGEKGDRDRLNKTSHMTLLNRIITAIKVIELFEDNINIHY